MTLTFLCANHKKLFNDDPGLALRSCVNTCEAGWVLYQQGRLQEALPYIGSAFETAEIVLASQLVIGARALDWFLHALAGLTQTLGNLGKTEISRYILQRAVDCLEQAREREPVLKTQIDLHVSRLGHELKLLEHCKLPSTEWAHLHGQKPLTPVFH